MSGWTERIARGRLSELPEAERAEALGQLERTRDRILDGAALRPGDDVLDLGAGAGLLTFGAHERIGDGWVYAVDPEVGVLEELLRAAHELEAPGIVYLLGAADVLPLPDESVDAAVTRSALADAGDLAGAAGELVRVLRPGGRISLREPDGRELTDALRAAGFADVLVELEAGEERWTVDERPVDAGPRRTAAWVTARKP